ncbi:hypothetical protein [Nocardioides sp. Arc9.136]|uniref:phage tail tube protein n=1 Tax=Nocardioides sp. Arc9.136 TaxID=2996826 RepID=UPI0026669F11|nr:hypothetical protein [Nocardioides sp. Arc9.136]WKN47150.1 hypothetical protein OSR43_13990 [Nocardioides sp. Arc9.136]
MPRSLADGHKKIAVLTEKPVNPAAPTAAELAAGIGGAAGAGCRILLSDWVFGPTDSDTFNDRAVCEEGNSPEFGASNYQAGMTVFRYFDEIDGTPDAVEDALFDAVKVKGTTLWIYERETGQPESEPWTTADDIWFGAEVRSDNPQRPGDAGGYVKRRIPLQVKKGYPGITVGPVVTP